jgi:hypothetical protein
LFGSASFLLVAKDGLLQLDDSRSLALDMSVPIRQQSLSVVSNKHGSILLRAHHSPFTSANTRS